MAAILPDARQPTCVVNGPAARSGDWLVAGLGRLRGRGSERPDRRAPLRRTSGTGARLWPIHAVERSRGSTDPGPARGCAPPSAASAARPGPLRALHAPHQVSRAARGSRADRDRPTGRRSRHRCPWPLAARVHNRCQATSWIATSPNVIFEMKRSRRPASRRYVPAERRPRRCRRLSFRCRPPPPASTARPRQFHTI